MAYNFFMIGHCFSFMRPRYARESGHEQKVILVRGIMISFKVKPQKWLFLRPTETAPFVNSKFMRPRYARESGHKQKLTIIVRYSKTLKVAAY